MRVCPKCQLGHIDPGRTHCVVDGEPLVEVPDPRVGTVLAGRYVLEELIGEGGMASVYRARHTIVDRPFAVKILRAELARDPAQRERLRREGRSAAALTHPNIVETYDFGTTDDGAPYLVMELLSSGVTLRAMLEDGALPVPLAIEVAVQIAIGLARAHDFGVVHRDLKPENVFVMKTAEDEMLVKIVDFGIARSPEDTHLTSRGEILGTPQYMAPERATQRDVGPSSDLYSLGVVLFEMVTGRRPFESNVATSLVLKHMYEPPPSPRELARQCPPALEKIILSLLAKSPAERPVDAHRVVALLSELAPREVPPTGRVSWVGKESRALTGTVDAWAARLASLRAAIERAGPSVPGSALESYAELHTTFERLKERKEAAWQAQFALDALEREGREGSERLGHAVHVLGVDLSRAREEQRLARSQADETGARARAAGTKYRDHAQHLADLHAPTLDRLDARVLDETRAAGEAVEVWRLAEESAVAAEGRAAMCERAMGDLGFQIDELRKRLRHLEQSVLSRARSHRQAAASASAEQHQLEQRMIAITEHTVRALPQTAAIPAP